MVKIIVFFPELSLLKMFTVSGFYDKIYIIGYGVFRNLNENLIKRERVENNDNQENKC